MDNLFLNSTIKNKNIKLELETQSKDIKIPKNSNNFDSNKKKKKSENHRTAEEESCNLSVMNFDVSSSCQYFKSSFARSLSIGNNNETKSLNFDINLTNQNEQLDSNICLPLRNPKVLPSTCSVEKFCSYSKDNGTERSNHTDNPNEGEMSSIKKNNVWAASKNQENRKQMDENYSNKNLPSRVVDVPYVVSNNSKNIEAVILQTQINTLQWQLKQVESSREMYRALMEEVVRFLERCHNNFETAQQQENIHNNNDEFGRSKSTHQVFQNDINFDYNITGSIINPRARSSTNLIDAQKNYVFSLSGTKNSDEDFENNLSTNVTYNQFRDFTWRRSPKKNLPKRLKSTDLDSKKLSEEAFRLLRTAQNLLNTQEPDLTQIKEITDLQSSISPSATIHDLPISNSTPAKPKISNIKSNSPCCLDFDSLCKTLSRKINIRESRLSLQSITNNSVHSTSSSKNCTDEEQRSTSSGTSNKETTIEQESGFSSINSFQEIGLPLQSTMICESNNNNNFSVDHLSLDFNHSVESYLENRNDTLKPSDIKTDDCILLAETNYRNCNTQRIGGNSRPKFFRFSTMSTNDDDGPTVLWV